MRIVSRWVRGCFLVCLLLTGPLASGQSVTDSYTPVPAEMLVDPLPARRFRAFDARTGAVRWEQILNSSAGGYPVSYMYDGVQYVAIAAGGGVNSGQRQPHRDAFSALAPGVAACRLRRASSCFGVPS